MIEHIATVLPVFMQTGRRSSRNWLMPTKLGRVRPQLILAPPHQNHQMPKTLMSTCQTLAPHRPPLLPVPLPLLLVRLTLLTTLS